MIVRRWSASLLTTVFVVGLVAAGAAPAAAIGDDTNFPKCSAANDGNCIQSLTIGGTGVDPTDDSGADLNVFFSGGMLQIQLVDGTESGTAAFDLADVGVTTSTEVTIVLTVGNSFTPVMLIGSGVIDSWSWDDATNKLTITATPQAVSFTTGTCNISADCADADFDFDAMLGLAADDADVSGISDPTQQAQAEEFLTAYAGGYVATDAQTFSVPSYSSSTRAIQFDLGAPHLTATDALNTGFFNVFIPDAVLEDIWEISASSLSLNVTEDGTSVSGSLTHVTGGYVDGWLFESGTISYSTPTIALKPASSSTDDEPTELDLSTSTGTGPTTTRLPVALPETGEFTREVTLQGSGATLEVPQGTTVTLGGVPFTGTIDPPTRVQGRPAGLRSAVQVTATADEDAGAESVRALADDDEIVFDPPVTITIVDTSEEAANSRVVRIAPDGSITDLAGTMTGRGVQAQITGLGTYGLATELDLAEISSAPSVSVALPVVLPSDGVIDFPTTLNGDDASITFASGTAVTDASGEAFAGTLEAPAAAAAPSGTGSVVEVATGGGTKANFAPAATLTLTPPEGTAAGDVAAVEVTSATATSCLSGTLTTEETAIEVPVTATGTFGLALPVTAAATSVARDWLAAEGLHSQWAGQSAAPSLCAGQVAEIAVRLRNTGTTTWTAGGATPIVLAARDLTAIDSGLVTSPLYDTRLATHAEDSVAPGDVGTFAFKVRAPATAGTHRISVRPVAEGLQWLEDEGIYLELIAR